MVAGVLVAAAAVIAGGYLLGASRAPGEHDAHAERVAAQKIAFKRAYATGYDRGLSRGRTAGATAGRNAGATKGEREGRAAANSTIHRALVVAKTQASASKSRSRHSSRRPLPGSGGVLVVGDSLEVLTSPYLQQYLPSASLTINAEGGYNSLQIYKLFQESYDPSQSVIVFDAGTNDNPAYPQILAGRLAAVARTVGDRCMVVPTIKGLKNYPSARKNDVVRQFAASRPGTETPDWESIAASRPDLMQPDHLHPNI